jgi:hypothetical protein
MPGRHHFSNTSATLSPDYRDIKGHPINAARTVVMGLFSTKPRTLSNHAIA